MSLLWATLSNFNPRSREGSDNNVRYHRLQILHFNPRSREGSDIFESTYKYI